MYKIIILFAILSQFFLGCSLKKDKEIIVSLDCPKYFLISEATSKSYSGGVLLILKNDLNMNCYKKYNDPNHVLIDISINYELLNAPDYEAFEGTFTSLVFLTDRNETVRLLSYKENIPVSNNNQGGKSSSENHFLSSLEIQHIAKLKISLDDYKSGTRIFIAIN